MQQVSCQNSAIIFGLQRYKKLVE